MSEQRVKVEIGDTIKIQVRRGYTRYTITGEVRSSSDYGPGERFIEYDITECDPPTQSTYGYWQQPADGGDLIEHNGQKVVENAE
jgi:hypothetical protein